MTEDKVEGQLGFDKEVKEDALKKRVKDADIVTKEETMFRIDDKGIAIPEKYPVKIYDRMLDRETVDEGIALLEILKKKKAVDKIVTDTFAKHAVRIQELQSKYDAETDEKKKMMLLAELDADKNTEVVEKFKSAMNSDIYEQSITESREIINKLKKMKADSEKTVFVELIPCNTGEAYQAFERSKTVEGKDTTDWVADLIAKKVVNPQYSFDDAKNLKPEWKIALKESIMEASGYKMKTYRDSMMDEWLAENKPLSLKKE